MIDAALLQGIIAALFMGMVMGNYATSPIYRLPRKEPLFVRDPFCDSCSAPLKPKDLFPIFSWLSTRGHCRYCGATVPASYTIIEAATALIFVYCYLKYGFTEHFILLAFGITVLFAMAAMVYEAKFFSDKALLLFMVFGMLLRTLLEGTIYGFAGGAFAGLFAGVALWKIVDKGNSRDITQFPPYIKLLCAAGIWLPFGGLSLLIVALIIAYVLRRLYPDVLTWTILFGIFILLIRNG